MIAGVTRGRFPPPQFAEAEEDLQNTIVPLHEDPQFKQREGFRGALFLVNRDNREIIGITLWDTEENLRAVEEVVGRDQGGNAKDRLRNPDQAPNPYTRQRAQAVRGRGGRIEDTDVYDAVFEIRP
jgi:hypothetical protein